MRCCYNYHHKRKELALSCASSSWRWLVVYCKTEVVFPWYVGFKTPELMCNLALLASLILHHSFCWLRKFPFTAEIATLAAL